MILAPFLARNWPFANGSGRILDRFADNIRLGVGERLVQTSDNFPINVYADDLIGRHILMSGGFDRSIVQILLDHSQPDDVLLDIGSNIGYVSAVFLTHVRGSKAICIEPQPGVVDLLRKNMEQFGNRAKVVPIGLSDDDGMLRFHLNPVNRGASRVTADGETEIRVRAAHSVLNAMPRVDLIKIDVEGLEEPILRSMEPELRRLRPRAILFEDQTRAASPEGVIGSVLVRSGYRIFGVDKQLMRTRLVPITCRQECKFNDYLALL